MSSSSSSKRTRLDSSGTNVGRPGARSVNVDVDVSSTSRGTNDGTGRTNAEDNTVKSHINDICSRIDPTSNGDTDRIPASTINNNRNSLPTGSRVTNSTDTRCTNAGSPTPTATVVTDSPTSETDSNSEDADSIVIPEERNSKKRRTNKHKTVKSQNRGTVASTVAGNETASTDVPAATGNGRWDETVKSIPPPPKDVLRMSIGGSDDNLRKVVHPICREMFAKMEKEGYAKKLDGTYLDDFSDATHDGCPTVPLLYAIFDKKTGKLLKIGYTTNLAERICYYEEKGQFDTEHHRFVPFLFLHRLDTEMDTFCQEKYREMIDVIKSSDNASAELKRLLQVIVERGGEELGCKKKIIHLMIEVGAQLHYRLSAPADFLTCDTNKLQIREEHVSKAVADVVDMLADTLDVNKEVVLSAVTSWMTGYYESRLKNPDANFTSKCSLTEYVLSCAVDLEETDTLPAPVHKNPKTVTEAFSKDYKKVQLEQGIERLHNFVRGMKDNTFMILDTNDVLFEGDTSDVVDLLVSEYGYRVVIDLWDGECIFLKHEKHRKVIAVHRPISVGADSRSFMTIFVVVLRCMMTELLSRVCQCINGSEAAPVYTADGIFAGYAFEYTRGVLFGGWGFVPAAIARDAMTLDTDLPLRHNGLGKTIADPNYPITDQLRKEYRRGDNQVECPLRPLIIHRAMNLLSYIEDSGNPTQLQGIMDQANTIILSDDPTYTTRNSRWDSAVDGLKSSSSLGSAVRSVIAASKKNKGNPKAFGLFDQEKVDYDEDFRRMVALGLHTPFYVRADENDDVVPPHEIPLYHTWTREGLRERLNDRKKQQDQHALRSNKDVYISERAQVALKVQRVLDSSGKSQYIGENGKQSFVLVELLEDVPNNAHNQTKDKQLSDIAKLPMGTRIWFRKNRKSSPTLAPPSDTLGYEVFNMPTLTGVKERLDKHERTVLKRGSSGEWLLYELAVKKRLPHRRKEKS